VTPSHAASSLISLESASCRQGALVVENLVEWSAGARTVGSGAQIHSFRNGAQSGSHGHVSCTPSKIPYVEFSPVRLQAERPVVSDALPTNQPRSSVRSAYPRPIHGLTPPLSLQLPSCLQAGIISLPASGHHNDPLGPRVLGSARVMLSLPSSLYDPIRQSRSLHLISQGILLIQMVFALRADMGYHRDLP
jgi:hypothetical protein